MAPPPVTAEVPAQGGGPPSRVTRRGGRDQEGARCSKAQPPFSLLPHDEPPPLTWRPQGMRRVCLFPLSGQLEFITTSPHSQPSLPVLWSPLESRCASHREAFLKGTRSGGLWGIGGAVGVGSPRCWWNLWIGPLVNPLSPGPSACRPPGCLPWPAGSGNWGVGVNTVSGSWTLCVMTWGTGRRP